MVKPNRTLFVTTSTILRFLFGNAGAIRKVAASILIFAAVTSPGATLTTPSYRITVEVHCPEGNVTCQDVKYLGIDKKTGKSTKLTGRTVHTVGADGVTPSRFLGYTFQNGKEVYFVSEEGEIRITQGPKVLVRESGAWKR